MAADGPLQEVLARVVAHGAFGEEPRAVEVHAMVRVGVHAVGEALAGVRVGVHVYCVGGGTVENAGYERGVAEHGGPENDGEIAIDVADGPLVEERGEEVVAEVVGEDEAGEGAEGEVAGDFKEELGGEVEEEGGGGGGHCRVGGGG